MERVADNSIIEVNSETFSQIRGFMEENGIIPMDSIRQIKNGRNSQVYLIEQINYF